MSGNNSSNEIFDATVLDSLHEAIGDSVNRIISIYIDDFPNNIKNMRDALEKQDYETVGRLAHSLKSSSGNLGAVQVSTVAAALEKQISQGDTTADSIATGINKLDAAFNLVKPLLISYIH